MDKLDAQVIADEYLATMQQGCNYELAFNYDITEEHPIGFVFFYNTKQFWKSRDFTTSLAGNGPLLIRRHDGEVIVLPSNRSVKRSLMDLADEPLGN